jgi:hypothetical protein
MSEPISFIPLDQIEVATPCRASWEQMRGNDSVRFCQTCAKNVYNLSAMTRTEAESLVQAKAGNLCVRFYQREDGTLLTDDCPVGMRLVRRRLQWLGATVTALLAGVTSLCGGLLPGRAASVKPASAKTLSSKPGKAPGHTKVAPHATHPTPPSHATMGEPVAVARPTPKAPPLMGKPVAPKLQTPPMMGGIAPPRFEVRPAPPQK